MEPTVVKKRGRPRKRRREEEEIVTDGGKASVENKKEAVERKPVALVGRYMLKEFEGSGTFLGKIVFYEDGLYRVNYEDGDSEDLESQEIFGKLLGDNDFDDDLSIRMKKLDELVLKNSQNTINEKAKKVLQSTKEVNELPGGPIIENNEAQVEDDDDSSGDSCEYGGDRDLSFVDEVEAVPPLELPPSSGTVGVPEQYVSYLFSVYGFLRSFSIRLFLNPFSLDDFVGSLNCRVPNTLLDAIHVALMRALRRHLETLSADGLELASKCLRCIDWCLLDTLTWPVYLVQYLTIMGYTKGPEWKGFYDEVLGREYSSLSVGRKLIVLQVLCDDVLESAELRTEIDMRVESEVGIDNDAEVIGPENVPRRVHPRYSKTSACKNRDSIDNIREHHEIKLPGNLNFRGSSGTKADVAGADMDVDRNSDECRLCGMDGTLLCCDGCPSAYHTRCIGVMKLSVPEGSWYCPECTMNKIGPTITTGMSVKGAEIFGIDSYGKIFLGTCNHLLVLKASVNGEPCFRYYNRKDIPKVLSVLCSTAQHAALYSGVCQAIMQYWDIPASILSLPEMTGRYMVLANVNGNANGPTLSFPPLKDTNVINMVQAENYGTSVSESNVETVASSIGTSLDVVPVDFPGSQNYNEKSQEFLLMHMKLSEGNEYASSVNLSSQSKEGKLVASRKGENELVADCVYMGSFYKPQAYLNHYMHGEYAASAAAKLASLLSEETRLSEAHTSDNLKKVPSENFLQAKAFSLTASRFFWPSFEKKLMEVPRERCGWCLSCKASVSSKRGCMLNHAALSATKGAMKILASLRPIKSGEGSLASITTYMLYMEESLRGLMVGPFLNANCRKQWRKQVEQASSCSEIKVLLLELEENIRIIALSSDWVKLVDDWLDEYSLMQSAAANAGTTQRRGPGGRRGRRQSVMPDLSSDGRCEKNFVWWQGGKQTKHIFQKAICPLSMVKRAARQGGLRRISGVCYTDGSEVLKRSRQLVWRASVEMSKNASLLMLQVRYLDLHLRWSDLAHPELDSKSTDTEASAFRNGTICIKRIVEKKVQYGVAFGSQKHLPSRILKQIVEVERKQDGKDLFWFPENRVPLYLIKEYEGRISEVDLPSIQEPFNLMPKLQKRLLRPPQRDIFFYLVCKRDNLEMCTCCSCQKGVILRNAVKCSACKGYSHMECALSSTFCTNEEVEFLTTCKKCYPGKALAQKETCNESPTSPLHMQVQGYKNQRTVSKGSKSNLRAQDSRSKTKATSESSLAAKNRRRLCSWGIIWKKKNVTDDSANFRQNNILLGGGSGDHRMEPSCYLCRKPYRSDLMYMCCETCKNWYHAEALELEESRIFDVAGFKCCRCRRIKSPVCPYADGKEKMLENKKPSAKLKREISEVESEPVTPMFPMEEVVCLEDDDPLLFSLSRVELIREDPEMEMEWDSCQPGPQKLPIRRHAKHEGDVAENSWEPTGNPAESDVSALGYKSEPVFDDEAFENMGYEPQTLFTFSELLGVDASEDQPENNVKCQSCSNAEPDLCCESCGLWMHSYCLPPSEPACWEGSWKCSSCREWC
ncbi:hypothetical protein UlMin_012673 [Ulmus minor]